MQPGTEAHFETLDEGVMEPTWEKDGIQLYLGDCLDVLPTLGKVDAVVTDPPYGIGEAAGKNKSRSKAAVATDYGCDSWDDNPITAGQVQDLRNISDWQILFGGNFFNVPPSSCWLVWNKLNSGDFADCELAWTNLPKAVRKIDWLWNGMIRKRNEERFHPTQKPLGVMIWCIKHLPADTETILDPFMGSGTTGVACVNLGRKFIGIEKEPKYFEIAVKRIERALSEERSSLFPVAKEVQSELF